MNPELEAAVVAEFLKLGLFERRLSEMQVSVVESFGRSPEELHALILTYHSDREALLKFQQFLEAMCNTSPGR